MKFDETVNTSYFAGIAANQVVSTDSEKVEVVVSIPARLVVSKLQRYLVNCDIIIFEYDNDKTIMGEDYNFIKKNFPNYSIKERKSSLKLERVSGETEEEENEELESQEEVEQEN